MGNIYYENEQFNTEELNSEIDNRPSLVSVSKFLKVLWYVSFLLIFPIIIHIILANKLKKLKFEVITVASNIDAQLNLRRTILIKMIETVKAIVTDEKGLFEKFFSNKFLSNSNKIENNESREEISDLNNSVFNKLLTIRENYPELKINKSFLELIQQSVNIEREIVFEKNNYNMYVTIFNEKMLNFPTNIVASSSNLWTIPHFKGNERDRRESTVKY